MTKYFSVLGDSISSYGGYSDDFSVNTTLSQNVASGLFRGAEPAISPEETWWMKTIRATGMKLLVNNTWGGARVFGPGETEVRYNTYKYRWDNLHSDTGELKGTNPDVIAIYIGINDVRNNYNTIGSFETINFDTLITKNNGIVTYAEPNTFAEAYAVMLHKIINKYPDADVYCFNLLPEAASNERATAEQVEYTNGIIFALAEKFNVNKVDLYGKCGITAENADSFMIDGLHPNPVGMDLIADVLVDALSNKYSF